MKIGIILTGIVEESYLDKLILCYQNIHDDDKYLKIISTWSYTNKAILDKLSTNGFTIVLSEFPNDIYPASINYIYYSFNKGLEMAKKLNCTHTLQCRSDVFISNIEKLLEIYTKLYLTNLKPVFLTIFTNTLPFYLLDYLYMFDIKFYDNFNFIYKKNGDDRFNEQYLQEIYFGTSELSIIRNNVNLSFQELYNNNIEILFLKAHYRKQGNVLNSYFTNGVIY
jgi:hypothetical protein